MTLFCAVIPCPLILSQSEWIGVSLYFCRNLLVWSSALMISNNIRWTLNLFSTHNSMVLIKLYRTVSSFGRILWRLFFATVTALLIWSLGEGSFKDSLILFPGAFIIRWWQGKIECGIISSSELIVLINIMLLCYLLELSVRTFAKIKWSRLKELVYVCSSLE